MFEEKNKFIGDVEKLIDVLVTTNKSTTKLLENFTNNILNVELLEQFPFEIDKGSFLRRQTLLFFNSIQEPVIYSESILNFNRIKPYQKKKLTEGKMTIGRVFIDQEIYKKNIVVENTRSRFVREKLFCNSVELYCKQYEMLIDREPIGIIKEFFSEETIQRVKTGTR